MLALNNNSSGRQFVTAISRAGRRRRRVGLYLVGVIGLLASPLSYGVTHSAVVHNRATRRIHNSSAKTTAFNAHLRIRFIKWNPMFPGSHDLLVQQNVELDRLQLPRIADDVELMHYELAQELVPVSESSALKIAENLSDSRRYCRPWTRAFLEDFSQAFYNQFLTPIQVNSLVRTAEQQRQLRRHNRYAAPEIGDTASTHLTGVTVDLSRRGFTRDQYDWVRNYMLPLKEAGMIDPIEERQPVLHVVVYDTYAGSAYSRRAADIPTQSVLASRPVQNMHGSEASEATEISGDAPGGVSQP